MMAGVLLWCAVVSGCRCVGGRERRCVWLFCADTFKVIYLRSKLPPNPAPQYIETSIILLLKSMSIAPAARFYVRMSAQIRSQLMHFTAIEPATPTPRHPLTSSLKVIGDWTWVVREETVSGDGKLFTDLPGICMVVTTWTVRLPGICIVVTTWTLCLLLGLLLLLPFELMGIVADEDCHGG